MSDARPPPPGIGATDWSSTPQAVRILVLALQGTSGDAGRAGECAGGADPAELPELLAAAPACGEALEAQAGRACGAWPGTAVVRAGVQGGGGHAGGVRRLRAGAGGGGPAAGWRSGAGQDYRVIAGGVAAQHGGIAQES